MPMQWAGKNHDCLEDEWDWIEESRPTSLEDCTWHPDVDDLLRDMMQGEEMPACPHTLFYGCPGGGKMTRVMAMLRALYGDGEVDNVVSSLEAASGRPAGCLME